MGGGKNGMALIKCPECGNEVSDTAQSCPKCGYALHKTPACPKCGSYNVQPISNASKVAGVVAFGIFSAHNVVSHYKCKDCGHKF